MLNKVSRILCIAATSFLVLVSCSKDDKNNNTQPNNPDTAEVVPIDRFSAAAGKLFVRTATNGLPGPNDSVNFDQGPFITKGLGPAGQKVEYYNFDEMPTTPAPIYVFFKKNQASPVPGQLNVINVIPGDAGYNDFWQVFKVTVPDDYIANTISSSDEVLNSGYLIETTNSLVNCPVVPKGSTASKRLINESSSLIRCWYKRKVVYYFNFGEKNLTATTTGLVPLSPIYVSFNINPDEPNGGPVSGFKTEPGTDQTHNVVATLPADAGYSPLWTVVAYDNNNFNNVSNLNTAATANILVPNAGNVNCPIVRIQ
ncbi:MAG TPA: hypothetical protein VJ765_00015 [Chitinophagaceae bacterium]|nr:hypothetical protein [Chitinophagaceae bacterium]